MDFEAPAGYQPTYHPVPSIQAIYGGLKAGTGVYIKGSIPENIGRFAINFQCGTTGNCITALHFNPRFDSGELVVFNSYENGWKSEERPSGMPFRKGEDFELIFHITEEGYQVIVDGSEFHLFKHRVPVEDVKFLSFVADVNLESISIIGAGRESLRGYPGIKQLVRPPYRGPILGGLTPGMSLNVYGVIAYDAKRFNVSLLTAEEKGCDKALHLSADFRSPEAITLNSLQNGAFEEEEKADKMPLKKGQEFDLFLTVTSEGYEVYINSSKIHTFKHRIPFEKVKGLSIGGDVYILSIHSTGAGEEAGKEGAEDDDGGESLPAITATPLHNPSLPCTVTIPGALALNQTFVFIGKVPPDAHRFQINFIESSTQKNAFHFNPRFYDGTIVRNSNFGSWGTEERDYKFNPFRAGQAFEIVIRCGAEKFEVYADGKHLLDYAHRLKPFTLIDEVSIKEDVQLSYVAF